VNDAAVSLKLVIFGLRNSSFIQLSKYRKRGGEDVVEGLDLRGMDRIEGKRSLTDG
jgi:hypothetical protein